MSLQSTNHSSNRAVPTAAEKCQVGVTLDQRDVLEIRLLKRVVVAKPVTHVHLKERTAPVVFEADRQPIVKQCRVPTAKNLHLTSSNSKVSALQGWLTTFVSDSSVSAGRLVPAARNRIHKALFLALRIT